MSIEQMARERFGAPNVRLSSTEEMRFGSQGSKSVNLETGEWFDFEDWSGGHFEEKEAKLAPNCVRMIVEKYDYVDLDGVLRYQVCRYMPKDFRPRVPVGSGWREGRGCMDGVERLPYHVTEILGSDYVIVVEGEKDVDALRAAGYVATTKCGGASKSWEPSALQYFRDRDVYVVPDNDAAGVRSAEKTCAALVGVARSVRYAPLCQDMAPKADVSDWLKSHNTSVLDEARAFPEFDAEEVDADFVYDTLDADTITPVLSSDDFVEGVLIAGAMSVVYGPSNVGKTFWAADLAMHVAAGWEWRGCEVAQMPVLYVAAEGAFGIRNRVAAFRKHYEMSETLPFHVIPVAVNLLSDDEAVERLINTAKVKGAGMIVLDTLARVIAGGNENAPDDMGQLIGNCDRIREEARCHVMLVHHTGKDEARGARGHSSLRAATDTEVEVSGGNGVSLAKVTKQRELEIAGEFGFTLKVVELGLNTRGKEVTSCVVVEAEARSQTRKRKPGGKVQRTVLKALTNALVDHGRSVADQRSRIVSEELWQREAYNLLSGDSRHKSTTFRRSVDSLIGDEFVGYREGMAWVLE
jgi:5S rRNA maturation endonuclease (ribonuclease M5)